MAHPSSRKSRISLHTPLTEEEKKNRPKLTKPFLKRILSYLLPYWPRLLLVFIAIMTSSILSLLPPLLSGKIIDEGLIGKDFPLLLKLILLSFIVLIISNLINVLENYLSTWVAQHIIYDMKNQMYRHLQQMSHRFFTDNNQGDIITRMTTDINGIQSVIVGTLTKLSAILLSCSQPSSPWCRKTGFWLWSVSLLFPYSSSPPIKSATGVGLSPWPNRSIRMPPISSLTKP